MSDEFDPIPSNNYSSFWPLLILVVGLLIWSGYQDWAANKQRSLNAQQFQTAIPTITEAQNIGNRYVALMKDLVQVAQKEGKDSVAAKIVNDAIKAQMIQVQPNATNAAGAPVAPTPAPAAAK
jgi:cytoskeletal protein RodZ